MRISYNGLTSSFSSHRSVSLKKIHPFTTKKCFFPYRYKDPSFTNKFKGFTLQKDYFLKTLLNNRLNNDSVDNSNSMKIENQKRKIKTKTMNAPKEIILSSQSILLSPTSQGNIFNSFFNKNELMKIKKNPFIDKYGEFNFGFRNNYTSRRANSTQATLMKTTFNLGVTKDYESTYSTYKKLNCNINKTKYKKISLATKFPKLYVNRSTSVENFTNKKNHSQTIVSMNNEYIKSKL